MGVGPRTGTSYLMRRLTNAGFSTLWEPDEIADDGRSGGHYECPQEKLLGAENVIAKVWPGSFELTLIERAVVLTRDRQEQLRSIARQLRREDLPGWEPELILDYCVHAVEKVDVPTVLRVRMEELDDRLDEIFQFFMEGGYHASRSNYRWSHWRSGYRC